MLIFAGPFVLTTIPGNVIGRGGAVIRQINSDSGAFVKLADRPQMVSGVNERPVTIDGAHENVGRALQTILDKVHEGLEQGTPYENPTTRYPQVPAQAFPDPYGAPPPMHGRGRGGGGYGHPPAAMPYGGGGAYGGAAPYAPPAGEGGSTDRMEIPDEFIGAIVRAMSGCDSLTRESVVWSHTGQSAG